MSSSISPSMQAPNPMKKKVLCAVIAVVIGHAGVLWALNHMKAPELKPIDKDPLKVRFVKIQEPPRPEPPKPKEQPKKKEPVKPKEVKEVKVVDKPLPAPPKKVEKIQQVKKAETPKPVEKPVDAAPSQVVTTQVSETKKVTPAPAPQPVQTPVQPSAPATPATKNVSIGGAGIQWSRTPRPAYSNSDLQGQTRTIIVMIEADEKGKITNARVTRSSGLSALDEKILRAVRNAKFKPYKENGVAYPIRAEQPFELTLNPNG